jgi:NitT/TauT family transport system ATP-binding protein
MDEIDSGAAGAQDGRGDRSGTETLSGVGATSPASGARVDGGTPKIGIDAVTITYRSDETHREFVAVRDLSLEIRANEFLCIVGPSGCGKSTLISAIAGFLQPAAGRITIDGHTIAGPGADRGVVFQEYALLPWKRVIDNVALGLELRGIGKADRHATARQFLELTGLADAAEKFPHELSGGMKQRAAVARTLANSPEVMLMDEPFAAVDAQTRMTLQEELVRIWAQSRVTVVFVTHSVEEAVFLSDRIVVLESNPGRIKSILDNPIDRNLRQWSTLGSMPEFIALRDRVMQLVRTDKEADAGS